jgi:protein O-mannosyl-transferase
MTLALYWPAGQFDFVDLDDPGYVFKNEMVRQGLSAPGLMWSLADAHESNWHPVTWVSHMLDCQLFGVRPGAHHLVSVGLHCANTVLLFLVLRAMTGAFWRGAFAAAIFAWHPLRVESVAWISERKDVLGGLFFLLTLYAYVKYAEERSNGVPECRSIGEKASEARSPKSSNQDSSTPPVRSSINPPSINPQIRYYALALLFFALGLMSKPMLVTTPFVLLLLDYWPLRRLDVHQSNNPTIQQSASPSLHHSITPSLHLLREKLPFFVLSILGSLIAFYAQRSGGAVVSMSTEGFPTRVEHALLGGLGYLEKFFWPQHLAIFYLPPHNVKMALPALAVFLIVSAGVVMTLRRRPYLAVGWLWFVGMLVPVCGLVQVGPQYMADRYTYLPGIGLAVMLAWGAAEVFALIRNSQARRLLSAALAALLLVGCWVASRRQLQYWRNTETLMDHALEVDPQNYMAHNLLGAYFTRLGQPEAAALHHRLARELWPH